MLAHRGSIGPGSARDNVRHHVSGGLAGNIVGLAELAGIARQATMEGEIAVFGLNARTGWPPEPGTIRRMA